MNISRLCTFLFNDRSELLEMDLGGRHSLSIELERDLDLTSTFIFLNIIKQIILTYIAMCNVITPRVHELDYN